MDNQQLIELLERAAIEQDARVNANTRGHKWITDSSHVYVYIGDHNIITCAKCGYSYCISCHNTPLKDCPE